MKNFDLNSWRWRRIQEINNQIADLEKEREQISKNLRTIISREEPLILVPPVDKGDSNDIPWGWIIAIVIIFLIFAGLGKNEQPNNQPAPTQSTPAQSE